MSRYFGYVIIDINSTCEMGEDLNLLFIVGWCIRFSFRLAGSMAEFFRFIRTVGNEVLLGLALNNQNRNQKFVA